MLCKTNSPAAARRLFLRARNGKLTSSRGIFLCISGAVSKIEFKEHVDNDGVHYHNWHLLIDDAACGEYYDVAFSQQCDGFGYILSSLLTEEGLKALEHVTIDFTPYKVKGTMAVVSTQGRLIPRGERMPALDRTFGDDGKAKYDGSARLAWLLSAAERVNAHIHESKGDVLF